MEWNLKTISIVVLFVVAAAVGGVVGTVYLLDAIKQPEVHVREVRAGLVDCRPGGWFTSPIEDQYVVVDSFRLANTGEVAGYIDIAILVDGKAVRTYTFLVLPGEDGMFYPSSSDRVIGLQGCDAQEVSYDIGNIRRA